MKLGFKQGDRIVVKVTARMNESDRDLALLNGLNVELSDRERLVRALENCDRGEVEVDWIAVPRSLLLRLARTLELRASARESLARSTLRRAAKTVEVWAKDGFR